MDAPRPHHEPSGPPATTLQTPDERDACGIGFVAHQHGQASHGVLQDALDALANLEHRGAVAADGRTGDGAGVLTQLPRGFFEAWLADQGISLDPDQPLGVGMLFLPVDGDDRAQARTVIEEILEEQRCETLAWRQVPLDQDVLGQRARQRCPAIWQVLVSPADRSREGSPGGGRSFEDRLYLARRRIEARADEAGLDVYIPSFSTRTIVYKGLMVASQLDRFYPDLADPAYETAIAVFHQRYSTNTWPSWPRAQPFRMLGHNGEINTLQGNVNWMRAREADLADEGWGEAIEDLTPVIDETGSDSAMLDNVLELVVRSGRDPLHGMLMLMPEAYEGADLPDELAAFYEHHALSQEPWDGPAAVVLTDGTIAHATLDRNGLRPLRYWVTADDRVIVASEAGVVPVPDDQVVERGRLGPGQRLAVDTETGHLLRDDQVKAQVAGQAPYRDWVEASVDELPEDTPSPTARLDGRRARHLQLAFDYGEETLSHVLAPMAKKGKEPIYSMGDDTPLAFLSKNPQLMHRYLKQRFAQVTNPPIDPYRETLVMSLTTTLGPAGNLLDRGPSQAHHVRLRSPVLTTEQFEALSDPQDPPLPCHVLETRFPVANGPGGLEPALQALCHQAGAAVRNGQRVLVLTDRVVDDDHAPIPGILAVSAIHHHLIDQGLRMQADLVVDSAAPREDHHLACLIGFGADAIHPYLAYETVRGHAEDDEDLPAPAQALANYRKALEKGLLKIMSKLGISTVASYRGAQTFEAIGLDSELIDAYMPGTPHRVGGIGLEQIATDMLHLHAEAYGPDPELQRRGFYRYRKEGEYHAFNPNVFTSLHKAVQDQDEEAFQAYVNAVDERPPTALRDLVTWAKADEPVPLDEVEPAERIAQRFATGAMSHGSISAETHETIAIAMNRLGAKSNTGEGGEDPERYRPYEQARPDRSNADWHPSAGDSANSHIKQVASGRFGVTPYYLASASELEIKMAQGSKPGEGGQIPGHKVSEEIAELRCAVPGVSLISPPPHHDIYSIEDLAQLIWDLKRANQEARVAVKLVALSGVGTIAAGVAKGYADTIQISGHDGGTGASPLSSIKHAGVPWELGLAETQQTLVDNDLRGRVSLRVDGGLKTGRDVVLAALLGAEQFGFGTAALVATGCVMTRQCHLNTCPVGIATQRPELRERFPGTPDQVIAFFLYVAQQVRYILAEMGFRRLDEVIGRPDLIRPKEDLDLPRADGVDLSDLLHDADPDGTRPRRQVQAKNDPPSRSEAELDQRLLEDARPALDDATPLKLSYRATNRQRTIGGRLGCTIARATDGHGLPPGTVDVRLEGIVGQSFGAFTTRGMRLELVGEAQDYVGKGMDGGQLILRPPEDAAHDPRHAPIMGNTVLYGATGGRVFAAGAAGERLCVRNSGAVAVTEGAGDHACEYMTGGVAVILGPTGRNLGAGMSGGLVYVLDEERTLGARINPKHVFLHKVEPGSLDAELIEALVARHHEATSSELATELLEGWPAALERMRKVTPRPTGGEPVATEEDLEALAEEALEELREAPPLTAKALARG